MTPARLIPRNEIKVDSTSYVDPNGRLFEWKDSLYRGIVPEKAEFFRRLLTAPSFLELRRRGAVVETEATELELEGFGLVLGHRRLAVRSYCVEWPPEMLRAAGLLTLEVCLELLKDGMILQDASPWNILFEGPRPVFVDVGSIRPVEEREAYLWTPYQQFCNLFLFPLYLYQAGLHSVARRHLYDFLKGVSYELCSRLLPASFKLTHPQVFTRLDIPLGMSRTVERLGLQSRLKAAAQDVPQRGPARESFLRGLLRDVRGLRLPVPRTPWAHYYEEWPSWDTRERWNAKQRVLGDLLERLRPRSVLDVACNRGWYSILAARAGARVLAFDNDEGAVSLLYREVEQSGLQVLPLVMDLLNPPPAFGWRLCQFPSALDRLKGELVLALALIHHLVFTQLQDFDRVAALLSDVTGQWLVLEFVPIQDDKAQEILRHQQREEFEWYTLDNLDRSLGRYFPSREVFDSWPEGRKLILCSKGLPGG